MPIKGRSLLKQRSPRRESSRRVSWLQSRPRLGSRLSSSRIRCPSLRTSPPRWSAIRRLSPASSRRRRPLNPPPMRRPCRNRSQMLRTCRRPQMTRPRMMLGAMKLRPPNPQQIRISRKRVSRHRTPCSGNSRPGRRSKIRRQSRHSPLKLPRLRLCKMLRNRLRRMLRHRWSMRRSGIGSCKGTDRSRPSIMRGPSRPQKTSEGSGGCNRVPGQNVRLYGMRGHRINLCKMPRCKLPLRKLPRRHLSCRPSASAIRSPKACALRLHEETP